LKPIDIVLLFLYQLSPDTLRRTKVSIQGKEFNLPNFGFVAFSFLQDETPGLNPHYSGSVSQLVTWGFRRR
jgi:hypothetical protein